MIFFEYRHLDNSIISSTIKDCPRVSDLRGREEENFRIDNTRNLFTKTERGSIRIIVIDEEAYLNSTKLAKKLLEAFVLNLDAFLELEKQSQVQFQKAISMFAHNLIEVQAQIKDKIDRIFTETVRRAGDYKGQKDLVKAQINLNPERAADDFCQIAKRLDDLEAQVLGFKILSGIKTPPNLGKHNVKKLFLRHAQPFFEELREMGTELRFISSDQEFGSNKVLVDPKMMHVALHHFFQNATKYTYPKTDILVSISLKNEETVEIDVAMNSLRIEEDELQSIFEQGVSGKNSKSLAGQGIGMFVIKKALEYFGATIQIFPDYTASVMQDDKNYVSNKFVFCIPKVQKS